jgi:divinyl protochlorophyllide a 8-vinyl-reductase
MAARAADAGIALIGPNAITRIAEALTSGYGIDLTRHVFARAQVAHYLAAPPTVMVPEDDFAALYGALFDAVAVADAHAVAARAGMLTGDYLLARRVPRVLQWLLPLLPPAWSATILARAIRRHAWTFTGSGTFDFRRAGTGMQLTVHGSPACRRLQVDDPACSYFAATFARVFSGVLGRPVEAIERSCAATGADCCRFDLNW